MKKLPPHFYEIYKDIVKAEKNKKAYARQTSLLKSKKFFPRTFRDIADKHGNLTFQMVSVIKRKVENENKKQDE